MDDNEKLPPEFEDWADENFPASENVPGQKDSRAAYRRMLAIPEKERPEWWQDFLELKREGWTWRQAAFIAWASSPVAGRWPATQAALAEKVLGLKDDRVIRKWREKNPEISRRIEAMQAGPLMKHRRDIFEALIAVAKLKDPSAHQDRKLALEMTGDYRPRSGIDLTTGSQPLKGYIGISPDDWDEEEKEKGSDA